MDAILIDEVNNKINDSSNIIIDNLDLNNHVTIGYYPYPPNGSQNNYSTLPIQFIPEYSGIIRFWGEGWGYVNINNVGISIPSDPEDEFLMDIPVIKNEPLIIDYVYDDEDETPLGEIYDATIYFSKGISNSVYSNYASNYTNGVIQNITISKQWSFPIYNIGNYEITVKTCISPIDEVAYYWQLQFFTNNNQVTNIRHTINLYNDSNIKCETFNITMSDPTILYVNLVKLGTVSGGTENLDSFINIKYIN